MGWTIAWVVVTAVSLASTALGVRYFLHMFQLNSYKPAVQRQWMKKNPRLRAKLTLPLVCGFLFWPKPAKVPLHYTARVKRMLLTIGLLSVAWFGLSVLLCGVYSLLFTWYLASAAPELVLISNWLNKPLERLVRRHYTNEALEKLRSHPSLLVIGITGSYGKTSVKHYLNTLLRTKFHVLMTPGGVNTPMGVVRTVREELSAAHEIFLCEMGAKNVGDIKELCDLVHPRFGIITSIGPQHLESFGTIDHVIATKFELADALPANGVLFANAENEFILQRMGKYPNRITYAAGAAGQYRAKEIAVSNRGTAFTVTTPTGEQARFETQLIGAHNVVNLVGAIAVAHHLGVPLMQLRGEMRKIVPAPHRLELQDQGWALVIDDGYNSNPAGAKAALDALALFEGEKILVTPGMIELGPQQEERNRAFGAQAAAVCDRILLVGAAQTRPIREGVLAAGFPPAQLQTVETLQQAIAAIRATPPGRRKIILLENDLPDNFSPA